MKYCKKCVMPDTKPYIIFDEEGVCTACRAHEKKRDALKGINWEERKAEFDVLINGTITQKAPFYDVVVPVSGGKDSITQVHRLLPYKMRMLAVNVDYGIKTEIGRHNLDLIPNVMGANLIIYRPQQDLHKRLIRIGLEDFGDPDLLSHTLLHAYPLWVALKFQVPLVLLGENSAFEYSGGGTGIENKMTKEWFTHYAANNGRDAKYISKKYNISYDLLKFYDYPDELDDSMTKALFSSHFFYWDSEEHLKIAKAYGFKALESNSEGTYRNYVGIDEKINRLHQYLKVLKFGYGRATDHACEDIRNGRITKEEAEKLVSIYDLQLLSDEYIDEYTEYLGYERSEFVSILEKYRNMKIWSMDKNGNWVLNSSKGNEYEA